MNEWANSPSIDRHEKHAETVAALEAAETKLAGVEEAGGTYKLWLDAVKERHEKLGILAEQTAWMDSKYESPPRVHGAFFLALFGPRHTHNLCYLVKAGVLLAGPLWRVAAGSNQPAGGVASLLVGRAGSTQGGVYPSCCV